MLLFMSSVWGPVTKNAMHVEEAMMQPLHGTMRSNGISIVFSYHITLLSIRWVTLRLHHPLIICICARWIRGGFLGSFSQAGSNLAPGSNGCCATSRFCPLLGLLVACAVGAVGVGAFYAV